ncbi:MAG TPA: signal recognition particle-docking protein FtsY [Acidimicrobiia bacterium]|nr:signal recognition particle-docking protein FtsY [Acidimicrobiia bacterium]
MDSPVVIIILVAIAALVVIAAIFAFRGRGERGPDVPHDIVAYQKRPATGIGAALRRAFGDRLEEGTWESLEEALIAADVGVAASEDIVAGVRNSKPEDVSQAWSSLADAMKGELAGKDRDLHLTGSPAVVIVVGVNGTGKTTTIAKLARRLQDQGKTVTLGAADTFRAAAAEQLTTWGDRLGVQVVRGQEGGDPASVAYDTVDSAKAKGVDVVIIDTAGRLHGKKNLMAELEKIHRVAGGDRVSEVLLVLDATAGQNGLTQVGQFSEAVPITGLVLTKLDGTARGGIVVAVERTLGVPVKFVGLGEGIDDLTPFDPDSFVDGLLS